jgi:Protein of unknown function (DUF1822)
MTNTTIFTFTSPNDLILEIPSDVQNQALRKMQSFSNPASQYQGYINELCLLTILPWLREEFTPQAVVYPSNGGLSSFWELINGTAIAFDGKRLILIPSEAMDLSELRVPQEWVDIQSLSGDYFLSVYVEPDDNYVRIWGYCTHAELKNKGNYDPGDRTYSLDASDIVEDITALVVAYQICPEEVTKSPIAPLPILPQAQAQNLISRLANPDIVRPRLHIPFQLWGALIEHGGWRKSLYQQRLGLPEQWSILQWLQSGVSQVAQNMGWESLNMKLSGAGARSIEESQAEVMLSRRLAIAGQFYQLKIIPQNGESTTIWRFELRNAAVGALIPGGFKLRLLTEDLQPFPNNEDIATTAVEQLFVEVSLEPGEGIVWEVEPKSENYDREILKF